MQGFLLNLCSHNHKHPGAGHSHPAGGQRGGDGGRDWVSYRCGGEISGSSKNLEAALPISVLP